MCLSYILNVIFTVKLTRKHDFYEIERSYPTRAAKPPGIDEGDYIVVASGLRRLWCNAGSKVKLTFCQVES